MAPSKIQDRALGRWRSILPAIGVPREHLTGKHGPCPCCKGGTDRFRFDDKDGSGSYFCNTCGAGNGVDLIMKSLGVPFADAKRLIEEQLPSSTVEVKKAAGSGSFDCAKYWSQCHPLHSGDPAAAYLARRGIELAEFPALLRFHPRACHVNGDVKTYHPAMVARFVSPDRSDFTLHTTFLDEDGNKAAVEPVRKTAPRGIPKGGAVRLSGSADTMGIAEGIETALSAMQLFDIPVWATLSSGNLVGWEPPATTNHVIIFADCDEGYGGQAAAFALAHKLKAKRLGVEVRLPGEYAASDRIGEDWNDELLVKLASKGDAAAFRGNNRGGRSTDPPE